MKHAPLPAPQLLDTELWQIEVSLKRAELGLHTLFQACGHMQTPMRRGDGCVSPPLLQTWWWTKSGAGATPTLDARIRGAIDAAAREVKFWQEERAAYLARLEVRIAGNRR